MQGHPRRTDHESTGVQAGFRRGRGTRDQITSIHWIMEKAREFQKNIYFCFIDYAQAFDCVENNQMWKFLKRWEYHTLPAFWETCMQVKKQQKQTWNNGLVPNGERSTSRLYTVILLRYIEYIIWNARLDDSHTKMNITWRNINSLRYADDTTLTAEKEKELKGGRGEWQSWLKTQHSKN